MIGVTLNLYINLGRSDNSAILSLLIHEQGIFYQLFIFSKQQVYSAQCKGLAHLLLKLSVFIYLFIYLLTKTMYFILLLDYKIFTLKFIHTL